MLRRALKQKQIRKKAASLKKAQSHRGHGGNVEALMNCDESLSSPTSIEMDETLEQELDELLDEFMDEVVSRCFSDVVVCT